MERTWFDANQKRIEKLYDTALEMPVSGQDPNKNLSSQEDSDVSNVMQVDESEEIVLAREEYRVGKTKKGFEIFSKETIVLLADQLGVEARMPGGKLSKDKKKLIHALDEKVSIFDFVDSFKAHYDTLRENRIEHWDNLLAFLLLRLGLLSDHYPVSPRRHKKSWLKVPKPSLKRIARMFLPPSTFSNTQPKMKLTI